MIVEPEQVDELWEHAHIYLTRDGRISMAGLNESNIQVSYAQLEIGLADMVVLC